MTTTLESKSSGLNLLSQVAQHAKQVMLAKALTVGPAPHTQPQMTACALNCSGAHQRLLMPNLFGVTGARPMMCFHHPPCVGGTSGQPLLAAHELRAVAAVTRGASVFTLPPRLVYIVARMLQFCGHDTDILNFPRHWHSLPVRDRLSVFATYAPQLTRVPLLPLTPADLGPRRVADYTRWAYFWKRVDASRFYLQAQAHPVKLELEPALVAWCNQQTSSIRLMGPAVRAAFCRALDMDVHPSPMWLDVWLASPDVNIRDLCSTYSVIRSGKVIWLAPRSGQGCSVRLRHAVHDPLFLYTQCHFHFHVDWAGTGPEVCKFTPAAFTSVRTGNLLTSPWSMDLGQLAEAMAMLQVFKRRPVVNMQVKLPRTVDKRSRLYVHTNPEIRLARFPLLKWLVKPDVYACVGLPLPQVELSINPENSMGSFRLKTHPHLTFSVNVCSPWNATKQSVRAIVVPYARMLVHDHMHFSSARVFVLDTCAKKKRSP